MGADGPSRTLPLSEPGILFGVIGSLGSTRPRAGHHIDADGAAATKIRRLAAVAALAASVGAFVQSHVALASERLARGLQLPSVAWVAAGLDWLPWLCIAMGVATMSSGAEALRRCLRLAGLAVVALAATVAAVGGIDHALVHVMAVILGLALGLHVQTVKAAGMLGVLVAAPAAVAAAVAAARFSLAVEGLAAALAASVIGLLLEPSGSPSRAPRGRGWLLRVGAWLSVVALVVAAASQATPSGAAVVAGLVAAALGAAACGRLGLACGAAVAGFLLLSQEPRLPAGTDRLMARNGAACAVYQRADQEMQVRVGGDVLAAAGPDRCEEPLLEVLLRAFAHPGDMVTLLGRGTGRIEPAARADGRFLVDVVDAWPAWVSLAERTRADGPVASPRGARTAPLAGAAVPIADLAAASRQLLCVCELPISATAHRATVAYQRQLRRVVGDGIVLQPFTVNRTSPTLVARLLDAARRTYGWNGVYRVGAAAVLVSGASSPVVGQGGCLATDDARWSLHRAHFGGAADVRLAFAGTLSVDAVIAYDVHDADVLLARCLEPAPPRGRGDGLHAWWRSLRAEMQRARMRVVALSDDAAGRREAVGIAAEFLAYGAPRPWLQAALGLADGDGVALKDPAIQSRCAHTLDPTFFPTPPAVFRSLPQPTQATSDLEDEHVLLPSERLARRCSGEAPSAIGLRARFPSRCARALVTELAGGPLVADQALALRELADPFVADEIARALLPEGRWRELLTFWRRDLPLPRGLRGAAATLGPLARRRLAAELRTHRDPSCAGLLADLLMAADVEVRSLAGEALQATVGASVAYDANWSRSRREVAASQLLALHNRKP